MATYQIVRVTEEPRLTDGKPAPVIRVEWRTEQDGPFFDYWPKADYDDFRVKQFIEERVRGLDRLRS